MITIEAEHRTSTLRRWVILGIGTLLLGGVLLLVISRGTDHQGVRAGLAGTGTTATSPTQIEAITSTMQLSKYTSLAPAAMPANVPSVGSLLQAHADEGTFSAASTHAASVTVLYGNFTDLSLGPFDKTTDSITPTYQGVPCYVIVYSGVPVQFVRNSSAEPAATSPTNTVSDSGSVELNVVYLSLIHI